MGMVASPSSSLNTPVGAGVASPGGEEAAYREKVRQLSKYIEPLRRMVHRMVSEGESEYLSNSNLLNNLCTDTIVAVSSSRPRDYEQCFKIPLKIFMTKTTLSAFYFAGMSVRSAK